MGGKSILSKIVPTFEIKLETPPHATKSSTLYGVSGLVPTDEPGIDAVSDVTCTNVDSSLSRTIWLIGVIWRFRDES